jgi:hypothetical protein
VRINSPWLCRVGRRSIGLRCPLLRRESWHGGRGRDLRLLYAGKFASRTAARSLSHSGTHDSSRGHEHGAVLYADVAWPVSCSVWLDDERPWRPQLGDAGATPEASIALRPLYEGAPDVSVRHVCGRNGSPLRVALGCVRSPVNEPGIGIGRVAVDCGPRCDHGLFDPCGDAGRGEHRLDRNLRAEREQRVDSDEHCRPTCSSASQDRPPGVCTRACRGGAEPESWRAYGPASAGHLEHESLRRDVGDHHDGSAAEGHGVAIGERAGQPRVTRRARSAFDASGPRSACRHRPASRCRARPLRKAECPRCEQ